MQPLQINGNEIIVYALKNNCSREIYDLLFKTFKNSVRILLCWSKNLHSSLF
jgi:hypothetical protein